MVKLKCVKDEDFVNYKKCSMFLAFPQCDTWKCEGCQNADLRHQLNIDVSPIDLVFRYLQNPLSEAIVFGGLEPLDTFKDMILLIKEFRKGTQDPIVIYTGYTESEAYNSLFAITEYKNIIMKFGGFKKDAEPVYDNVLGVWLASANQYAKEVS